MSKSISRKGRFTQRNLIGVKNKKYPIAIPLKSESIFRGIFFLINPSETVVRIVIKRDAYCFLSTSGSDFTCMRMALLFYRGKPINLPR